MKTIVPKVFICLLAVVIIIVLSACGMSKEAKAVTEMISSIGEVSIDSEEEINSAIEAYNALSDKDKAKIENYEKLTKAKEEADYLLNKEANAVIDMISSIGVVTIDSTDFILDTEKSYSELSEKDKEKVTNLEDLEKAKAELVYIYGKATFDYLNTATKLTIDVMDDIYSAWHFGIFEEYGDAMGLSNVTNIPLPYIYRALEKIGTKKIFLDWETSVLAIVVVYSTDGTYKKINENLESAKALLKTMSDEFSDYEYFPTLKEYYSKASSYYEFASSPTGSFNQLKDTINDYENSLRTYKQDLEFIFSD